MSEMFRGGLTKNYSQDYVERKKYLDFFKKSGRVPELEKEGPLDTKINEKDNEFV